MSDNPFDQLAEKLAALTKLANEINAKVSAPRPEWEPIAISIATRKRARRTLMWAVKEGIVKSRTLPNKNGRDSLSLCVSDLDNTYPIRQG